MAVQRGGGRDQCQYRSTHDRMPVINIHLSLHCLQLIALYMCLHIYETMCYTIYIQLCMCLYIKHMLFEV